jgi:ABC-type Fe3+ transport system substrate-binding protein
VPRSWADLLKPEDKGAVQVANPGSSGMAHTMIATLVQLIGKWWLWAARVALLLAMHGWRMAPGRAQGRVLAAGAAIGQVGLLASGFAIGAKGWDFESLNAGPVALPAAWTGTGCSRRCSRRAAPCCSA